ncbi:MAG: hypothetical protein IKB95_01550 [Bacteroidales bacterium]|nr:hypothetical protein [Bacteroidales bacterium]
MYIEVSAHRGNVAEYPKNTILAYKSAYEIGADMQFNFEFKDYFSNGEKRAKLITSNEPAFMIAGLGKRRTLSQGVIV